jgi:PPK2 family polyphosphate:nucleotide phosphotransferase
MKYQEIFEVKHGDKVDLSKIDPNYTGDFKDKISAKDETAKYIKELRDFQYRLYADAKSSLLICLQGLDAAGKDGTIVHVLGAMDPLGTRVCAFKVPSVEEASHNFLWRIEKQVPSKGEVVIFNRSHYEDVLVVRVHKMVPKEVWSKRFDFINNFEKELADNGTYILKFYLHISPEEQLKRFEKRLDDPRYQWKISESDYDEREFWKEYTRAYEDALSQTSTKYAPWYIIPSNHKWFRNLAVSQIVVDKFKSLGMKYPEPRVNLNEIRRKYHKAVDESRGR